MAKVIQKPLQDILKKLEKLDAIEEAVSSLGKSFEKLEGRIHTLEDAFASTKRNVDDLKESLNANETDKRSTAERIQKRLVEAKASSRACILRSNFSKDFPRLFTASSMASNYYYCYYYYYYYYYLKARRRH